MSTKNESGNSAEKSTSKRLRLPVFLTDEEIGLGDLIKRATSYIGIKPCGGCERRAAALNRWAVFTRHVK